MEVNYELELVIGGEGGAGSGNFGHKGRRGKRGGSIGGGGQNISGSIGESSSNWTEGLTEKQIDTINIARGILTDEQLSKVDNLGQFAKGLANTKLTDNGSYMDTFNAYVTNGVSSKEALIIKRSDEAWENHCTAIQFNVENAGLTRIKSNGEGLYSDSKAEASKRHIGVTCTQEELNSATMKQYMYTQKYYADQGIEEVTLYRGIRTGTADVKTYKCAPVESWTSKMDVAGEFAVNSYTTRSHQIKGDGGIVMGFSDVPVKDIFTNYHLSRPLGNTQEEEFILMPRNKTLPLNNNTTVFVIRNADNKNAIDYITLSKAKKGVKNDVIKSVNKKASEKLKENTDLKNKINSYSGEKKKYAEKMNGLKYVTLLKNAKMFGIKDTDEMSKADLIEALVNANF